MSEEILLTIVSSPQPITLAIQQAAQSPTLAIGMTLPGLPGKNGTNGLDGTNGVNGTNGADGARGDTGPSGSTPFTFNQMVPADSWYILHKLGKVPSVTIVDSGGNVVIGDIDYISLDEIIITFANGFGGQAYLN